MDVVVGASERLNRDIQEDLIVGRRGGPPAVDVAAVIATAGVRAG